MQTPFSLLSFGKFHENPFSRSRERLSGIFVVDGKTEKKTKNKKNCKTYTCHWHQMSDFKAKMHQIQFTLHLCPRAH